MQRAGRACHAVGVACGVWALRTGSAWAALPAGDTIRYGADKVTVRLHGAAPADVIAELARLSGAKVMGGVKETKPIIAEFDAVPVDEAMHRLLGTQNFTLVYGKGGKLSSIRLHGGQLIAGPPPIPTPGVPAAIPPPPANSPAALVALLDGHPPMPITGRLSQVLGTPTASFRQLLDVAIKNEEVPLRTESVRVIVNSLESEPDMRNQVLTALKTIDDSTVGSLIRAAAGDRAEEILIHAATLARASELRVKASAVLQHLRTQTPGS